MFRLLLIILTISHINIFAQSDCACCTDNHNQFDFWVGDWNVYDTTGKLIGENLIVKLEDNCLVNEHWKGSAGTTGRSYNYYDSSDSTWNQLWIDNNGGILKLKGKASLNSMVLQSDLQKGQKVDFHKNQITWTNNIDGTVTQKWDILDRNNSLLTTIFIGIYKKKETNN